MKLTKDERYTAYVLLLYEIEDNLNFICDKETGICSAWYSLHGMYTNDMYNLLPELVEKRTKNGAYWFNNYSERIAALKQCIAETENS